MSAAESELAVPSSRYVTKQEAAAYVHLSVSTLERAMRSGALRYVGGGPGGPDVRFRIEWLDEWYRNRGKGRG